MRSYAGDPRKWPVWQIPRRLLVAVLTVEATAVLLVARLFIDGLPDLTALWRAGVIVGLGIAQAEIAVGIERVRKQIGGPLHVDLCSVWTFAGALVLPPVPAVGVAVIVHTHLWWRSWRPRRAALQAAVQHVDGRAGLPRRGRGRRGGPPGRRPGARRARRGHDRAGAARVRRRQQRAGRGGDHDERPAAGRRRRARRVGRQRAGVRDPEPRRAHRRRARSSTRSSRCSRCPRCCSCTARCSRATWSRPPTPTTRPACSPRPRGTPAPSASSRGPPRRPRRCS